MVEEIIKVDGKDYKINYEGSLTDIQRLSVIRKIGSHLFILSFIFSIIRIARSFCVIYVTRLFIFFFYNL